MFAPPRGEVAATNGSRRRGLLPGRCCFLLQNPLSLAYARQLSRGESFLLCGKAGGLHQNLSPRGRWHGASRDGEGCSPGRCCFLLQNPLSLASARQLSRGESFLLCGKAGGLHQNLPPRGRWHGASRDGEGFPLHSSWNLLPPSARASTEPGAAYVGCPGRSLLPLSSTPLRLRSSML